MPIKYRNFNTFNKLVAEAVNLLKEHMQVRLDQPHAIMLPGGQTPLPAYKAIELNPFPVSSMLHIMMSDERMVPETSPENNFAQISRMLSSLAIPSGRIIKVHTGLSCRKAALQYDSDISAFFAGSGRLTLAMLGLGADGHTASLFSAGDIEKVQDRFAIPVIRDTTPDRVSVTRGTITRAGKIVFLAAGAEKENIIARLRQEPDSVIAGQAVKSASSVELWFSKESNK